MKGDIEYRGREEESAGERGGKGPARRRQQRSGHQAGLDCGTGTVQLSSWRSLSLSHRGALAVRCPGCPRQPASSVSPLFEAPRIKFVSPVTPTRAGSPRFGRSIPSRRDLLTGGLRSVCSAPARRPLWTDVARRVWAIDAA